MREVAKALLDLLNSDQRGALATVVRTTGSTPQQPGARLLLLPDDTTVGTVGGGAIEHAVLEALRDCRSTGASHLLERTLDRDLGMCCGGRMEVFIEPVQGAPRLYLFGAGHVAKATAPLARGLGFEVTVVDEREELATAERFPGCLLEQSDPGTLLKRAPLTERDWVLIATHDHRLDEHALELCIAQRPRYIGLVGSRRKLLRFMQRIALRKPDASFERVYAPVGLDLGAIGPEEIAVSIAAELVAVRRGKSAAHLRAVGEARVGEWLARAPHDEEPVG